LLVVLDDVGFAQIGCFGSDIDTPNIDALAARGLRYSSFHTTALCSPTRAAVLTGCNHHRVGMGRIVDLAMGFPGYTARIPDDKAMLPKMLTVHGYAAYAVGKWHLTPEDEEHLGATRATEGDVIEPRSRFVHRLRTRRVLVAVNADERATQQPHDVMPGTGVFVEDGILREQLGVPLTTAVEVTDGHCDMRKSREFGHARTVAGSRA
jgi:arylsulfatase A-like enzyme